MKRLRFLILLFAALAVMGCRVRPEQRAILTEYEHDLRRYEDLIYDLEYEYEILCSENERLKDKLAAHEGDDAHRESPRLFRPRSSSPPTNVPKPKTKKAALPEDELSPPEIEAGPMTPMTTAPPMTPTIPKQLPPEVPRTPLKENTLPPVKPTVPNFNTGSEQQLSSETPRIEKPIIDDEPPALTLPPRTTLPPKTSPALIIPATPEKSRTEERENQSILSTPKPTLPMKTAPPIPEALETLPAPKKDRPTSSPRIPELLPEPSDKSVSQIRIDVQQTHGINLDRHAGDDALRVVLVPLNAAGEIVPVAGQVSIVLLDPTKQGDEARVGRWDFAADFVRYQNHLAKRQQLTLDLPWSNGLPPSSQLTMFVRYEATDGKLVETNDLVTVKLPGDVSPQIAWTPRASHRRNTIAETKPISDEPKHVAPIVPATHMEEAKAPITKPEWKPYR